MFCVDSRNKGSSRQEPERAVRVERVERPSVATPALPPQKHRTNVTQWPNIKPLKPGGHSTEPGLKW